MNYFLKCYLTALMLQFALITHAQNVGEGNIYFTTAEYKLSPAQKKEIDRQLLVASNKKSLYKIVLTGHTDSVGGFQYNKQLSQQRADAVANYLIEKGFNEANIKKQGQSFTSPCSSNQWEDGKQKNRRVNMQIYISLPLITNIAGITSNDTTYYFDQSQGGTFDYSSGTQIKVDPGIFVNMDESEVKGEIKLTYKEYRDPVDFVLGRIPMSFMSKDSAVSMFNSSGMFKVEAYQGNKPLKIKKGKNLQVNIKPTNNLPNANFYKLDTAHGAWGEMAMPTPTNNAHPVMDIGPCGFDDQGRMFCGLDECVKVYYTANKGLEYSSSNRSLYQWMKEMDSLRMIYSKRYYSNDSLRLLQKEWTRQKDKIVNKLARNDEQNYRMQRKFSFGAKSSKLVASYKAKDFHDVKCLKSVRWSFEDNAGDSIFTKRRKGIQIVDLQDGTFGYMVDKKVVARLTMKVKTSNKKGAKTADEIFSTYRAEATNYYNFLDSAKIKIDSLKRLIDDAGRKIRVQNAYFGRDSLFCFWIESRTKMDSLELKMNMEEWIKYFDAHKKQMKKRYTAMKASAAYKSCEGQAIAKIKADQNMMLAAQMKSENSEKLDAARKQLNISSLGIYNCDQISRISNPVYVTATYTNEKGDKIEPVMIYLIDANVNGIIEYNGYNSYSPMYFAFSKTSRTKMLAFDESANAYVCSLSKAQEEQSVKGQIKFNFELKALADVGSKKNLLKELGR